MDNVIALPARGNKKRTVFGIRSLLLQSTAPLPWWIAPEVPGTVPLCRFLFEEIPYILGPEEWEDVEEELLAAR